MQYLVAEAGAACRHISQPQAIILKNAGVNIDLPVVLLVMVGEGGGEGEGEAGGEDDAGQQAALPPEVQPPPNVAPEVSGEHVPVAVPPEQQ